MYDLLREFFPHIPFLQMITQAKMMFWNEGVFWMGDDSKIRIIRWMNQGQKSVAKKVSQFITVNISSGVCLFTLSYWHVLCVGGSMSLTLCLSRPEVWIWQSSCTLHLDFYYCLIKQNWPFVDSNRNWRGEEKEIFTHLLFPLPNYFKGISFGFIEFLCTS